MNLPQIYSAVPGGLWLFLNLPSSVCSLCVLQCWDAQRSMASPVLSGQLRLQTLQEWQGAQLQAAKPRFSSWELKITCQTTCTSMCCAILKRDCCSPWPIFFPSFPLSFSPRKWSHAHFNSELPDISWSSNWFKVGFHKTAELCSDPEGSQFSSLNQ